MNLYLIQHGKAEEKEVNPDRPLTTTGRAETEHMAEMAAKLGLDVAEIRHSGKTRAEQTATIFARALSLMGNVAVASNLGATDDVRPVADEMAQYGQSVMLVGHKPFMPRLAGLLVNQNAEDSPVEFQNSGILCLSRTGDGWQVAWHLTPG